VSTSGPLSRTDLGLLLISTLSRRQVDRCGRKGGQYNAMRRDNVNTTGKYDDVRTKSLAETAMATSFYAPVKRERR